MFRLWYLLLKLYFSFWWKTKSFKYNKCHYVENQSNCWHILVNFEFILFQKHSGFLFFLLTCFFDYSQFFIRRIWSFFKNLVLMFFFFLRYFEMFVKIFLFFNLIIILILIFLNYVHKKNNSNAIHKLNTFNWIDIQLTHTEIYWIHLIMTLIVIGFVCYTIHIELMKYACIWQTYFVSFQHKSQKLVNAILIMNIFNQFLIVFYFTRLYNVFLNSVCAVWINRNLFKLLKKIRDRNRIVCKLEIAETKLLQLTIKSHN